MGVENPADRPVYELPGEDPERETIEATNPELLRVRRKASKPFCAKPRIHFSGRRRLTAGKALIRKPANGFTFIRQTASSVIRATGNLARTRQFLELARRDTGDSPVAD